MKTCQIEQSEKVTNFTLFPLQSSALTEIKENWFGVSALQPQRVMIRAIDIEQQRQILENPLTERELSILKMIVEGNSNSEIAQELYITLGTVKAHIRNIFCKLNVCDAYGNVKDERTQATVLALRSGLVD